MFLPLLLSASFNPVVNVEKSQSEMTIDLCASEGENLRFSWDYDNDGSEDQRGPCRRTVTSQTHIRVWEAIGEDRGSYEETIELPEKTQTCTYGPSDQTHEELTYTSDGLITDTVFDGITITCE